VLQRNAENPPESCKKINVKVFTDGKGRNFKNIIIVFGYTAHVSEKINHLSRRDLLGVKNKRDVFSVKLERLF